MAAEVGAAWIGVRPDLRGFHNTIKRELRAMAPSFVPIGRQWGQALQRGIKEKLNPIEVRMDAGRTAVQLATLNRALDKLDGRRVTFSVEGRFGAAFFDIVELQAALRRIDGKKVSVNIHVEMGGALAELRALEEVLRRIDGRTVRVRVDADTGSAISRLIGVNAELSRLDGRRANVNVGADVGAALAGIFSVKAALIGLGVASLPALVGIGAGLIGLLGPLSAAAVGFGGLAAVAIPAILRIREATQQQAQASQQAAAAAGQEQARAAAVASAQQQLAAARRNAAEQHRQAIEQVRQAELSLAQAQEAARRAQEDLTRARAEAARDLQDLQNRVTSAGLAVEESKLGVDQAKLAWQQMAEAARQALAKIATAQSALDAAQAAQAKVLADPNATAAQKNQAKANVDAAKDALKAAQDQKKAADLAAKQAELNYRQSIQRLKEQQLELRRLVADEKAARKAGVDGSDKVRQARERLADANLRIAESERKVSEARRNVARADQQAADQIASAQRALAQASNQASSAASGLTGKMIQLTTWEKQLAAAWKDLTKVFTEWNKSLQPDVLPVLIKGIGFLKAILPQLTPIVKGAAAGFGELLDRATAAAKSPFWTQFSQFLGQSAGPAIVGLGTLLGNLLKSLAGLAQSFAPIGFAFLQVLNAVAAKFAAFTTGLANSPGFKQFTAQFVALAPLMAQTFMSLGSLIGSLFAAFAPALKDSLTIVNSLASTLAGVFKAVAPSITAVFAALGPALSQVFAALGPVVTQLVVALAPLLVQLINGLKPILLALAPILGQVIAGLQPLISALIAGLAPAILALGPPLSLLVGALAKIILALSPILPILGQLIASLIAGLMPILTPIVKALTDVAVVISGALVEALRQSLPALQQILIAVASLLPELLPLVPLFGEWLKVILPLLPLILQLAAVLITALLPVLRLAIQIVVLYWTTIAKFLIPVFGVMVKVIQFVAAILTPIIQGIGFALRHVGTVAGWLWTAIKVAFNGIMIAGKVLTAIILVAVLAPILIAFNILKAAVLFMWRNVWEPAFKGIAAAVRLGWRLIQPLFAALKAGLQVVGAAMTWLWRNVVAPVWRGIKAAISTYWGAIKVVWSAIITFLRVTLGPVFTWLRDKVIKPVWSAVGTAIKAAWTGVIRPAFDALKTAVGKVRDAFKVAVEGIGKIWKGLESITKKPVQFVVNTVYNSGIRTAWNAIAKLVKLPELPNLKFASGGVVPAGAYGVLPGYAPGRDTMLAAVSPGEAWIRPDATRALGSSFIYGLNAAAASGGATGAARFIAGNGGPHFDIGGIVGRIKDAVGGAKNLVVKGAGGLLAKGASFAARKILDPILKRLTEVAGSSDWARAMTRLPRMMVTGFIDWLKKSVDPKIGGDGTKVVKVAEQYVGLSGNPNKFTRRMGMDGLAWCGMFVDGVFDEAGAGKALDPVAWTPLVSSYTSLPKVAQKDKKAGDLGLYRGDSGHINIFTGKGTITIGGNESNSVRRQSGYINSASSIRRPAFAGGGIVPGSVVDVLKQDLNDNRRGTTPESLQLMRGLSGLMPYDNGGWLPPGISTVINGTGRPELVLTHNQLRSLAGSRGADGLPPNVRVFIGDRELTDIVRVEIDHEADGLARALTTHGGG